MRCAMVAACACRMQTHWLVCVCVHCCYCLFRCCGSLLLLLLVLLVLLLLLLLLLLHSGACGGGGLAADWRSLVACSFCRG